MNEHGIDREAKRRASNRKARRMSWSFAALQVDSTTSEFSAPYRAQRALEMPKGGEST